MLHRRDLLFGAGSAALLAQSSSSKPVGRPAPVDSTRKIRLAIIGGNFGTTFFFHQHPNCVVAAVSDLRPDRRKRLAQVYRCDNMYASLEELLEKEKRLDAVALFTPAPDHVRHAELVMRRGLHVFSAVPACFSLEEADKLRALKEQTGLRYMMGETSYYRPGGIYARALFETGGFGELFYSELMYYHDRGDLDELLTNKRTRFYEPDGSQSWRWGIPPLHYPTHAMGFLVGVTGERIRSVSALGWGNQHPFVTDNKYKNPFFNESALMETDKGHISRCNVFWLVGGAGERAQWLGDKGSLYMENAGLHGDIWTARPGENPKSTAVHYPDYLNDPMIPEAMRHASGHGGSQVFLCAEFINALVENREPAVDVYKALAMTVPGIIGHQSALRNGERLKVPNFG